jgi:hypothetical protein
VIHNKIFIAVSAGIIATYLSIPYSAVHSWLALKCYENVWFRHQRSCTLHSAAPIHCSLTEHPHPTTNMNNPFTLTEESRILHKTQNFLDTVTATQHIVACCLNSFAYQAHYSLSINYFKSQGFLRSGPLPVTLAVTNLSKLLQVCNH